VSVIRIGDLTVNRLGFGAMRVIDNDNIWGEPSDRKHAHKVLRRAAELGVNFFDTAESYGPHTSETLIGEALHPYPKGLVVATTGRSAPTAFRQSWSPTPRSTAIRITTCPATRPTSSTTSASLA
jgi:aryl-alcohol dehydrogenase-like predicted oxidoreductase